MFRAAVLVSVLTAQGAVADELSLRFRALPFVARVEKLDEARELPASELDLGYLALLVARRAHPDVDVDAHLDRLDGLARGVLRRTGDRATAREAVAAIAAELDARGFRALGGMGDARNAYLDLLLRKKQGFCLSLSVLYMALGERIGVPIAIVELPDHYCVRVGEPPAHANVETTASGRLVSDAAYRKRHPFERESAGYYLRSRDKRRAVAGLLMAHGLVRWNASDTEGAIAAYREALTWAPDHLYTSYNLAVALTRAGQYGEALARYKAYLKRRPKHAVGWFGLARVLLRLDDLHAAEEALDRARELAPRSPEVAQMKAELAMARGEPEQAMKALGRDAKSLEARFLIVRAMIQKGQLKEAEAELRRLMREHPKVPELPRQLAVVLKVRQRFDAAAEVLAKLVREHPDQGSAWVELGALREIQGRHAEAARCYGKALAITDAQPDLFLRAARAMLEAGRGAEAASTCERGLKRHPDGIKARQLAKFGGDIYALRLGDRARARALYETYVALGGEDPEVLSYLGARSQ